MEDPIRYISNREANLQTALGPGIELFETPNYVLGFAAAMMNEVSSSDGDPIDRAKQLMVSHYASVRHFGHLIDGPLIAPSS